MITFIIAAADGTILQTGQASGISDVAPPDGGTVAEVSDADAEALRVSPGRWRWVDGALVPFMPPVDLEALRASTTVVIDAAAEAQRLRFLTPGSGQCAEYLQTEAEARAYDGTGAAEDWPWLSAEQTALASVGQDVSLADVASAVIAQADAWRTIGAAIKALRRGAKLQVAAATTAAEIRAAAVIGWPSP